MFPHKWVAQWEPPAPDQHIGELNLIHSIQIWGYTVPFTTVSVKVHQVKFMLMYYILVEMTCWKVSRKCLHKAYSIRSHQTFRLFKHSHHFLSTLSLVSSNKYWTLIYSKITFLTIIIWRIWYFCIANYACVHQRCFRVFGILFIQTSKIKLQNLIKFNKAYLQFLVIKIMTNCILIICKLSWF